MARCLTLLLFFLLLCPRCGAAATEESRMALSRLAERVERLTLPNGLRILLYKRGEAPVFAGAVVVRVGSVDEQLGTTGLSHMFEHMAFKGTTSIGVLNPEKERRLLAELELLAKENPVHPEQNPRWAEIQRELEALWVSDAFSREYERRGAVGLNATTSPDFTEYFVNMPRAALRFWCEREADRLIDPVLRQFYKERAVVMEERRWRFVDDPMGRMYITLLGHAFLEHPYRLPTIGYEGDLERLTATQAEAFHRRFYVPGNIVVSLVGDVDLKRDGALLRECFGAIPAGDSIQRTHLVEPPQQGEREFTLHLDAAPSVIAAFHKPVFPDRDDIAITVLEEILARGRTSRLYKKLVLEEKLAVSTSYTEGPGVAFPNLSIFILPVREPHAPEEVLTAFERVLEEVKRQGVQPMEVEVAKRRLSMSYLNSLDSNQSVALDIASSELLYGDFRTGLTWFDALGQVTPEDVQRVARQYFTTQQRTVGFLKRLKQ